MVSAALSTLLPVHLSYADEGPRPLLAQLEWTAPAGQGCPSAPDLTAAVESRLDRRVFVGAADADVRLSASFRQDPLGWSALLRLYDARGRTLGTRDVRTNSKRCVELEDTLAVVIALLIDVSRVHILLSIPTSTSARRVQEAEPQSTEPLPPVRQAPSTWEARLSLLAEGTSGQVGDLGLGMAAQAGIELGWVPFEGWVGGSVSVPPGADRASLGFLHGGVQLCPSLFRGVPTLSICAGGGVGVLHGRGTDFVLNQEASRVIGHLDGAFRADVDTGDTLFLRFELGAVVPTARPRFVFRSETGQIQELHRARVVVPRLAFGVGVRLY